MGSKGQGDPTQGQGNPSQEQSGMLQGVDPQMRQQMGMDPDSQKRARQAHMLQSITGGIAEMVAAMHPSRGSELQAAQHANTQAAGQQYRDIYSPKPTDVASLMKSLQGDSPNLVKEWTSAVNGGYTGTLADWKKMSGGGGATVNVGMGESMDELVKNLPALQKVMQMLDNPQPTGQKPPPTGNNGVITMGDIPDS